MLIWRWWCSKLESRKAIFTGDEYQKLSQCNHDVSEHIYSLLHVKLNDITEAQLIANRLQKDNLDEESIICPYHRYKLGIGYRPSTKCVHPNHVGRRKGDSRKVNKLVSELCNLNYGVTLRIGDGLCRTCRDDKNLERNVEQEDLGMSTLFFKYILK